MIKSYINIEKFFDFLHNLKVVYRFFLIRLLYKIYGTKCPRFQFLSIDDSITVKFAISSENNFQEEYNANFKTNINGIISY